MLANASCHSVPERDDTSEFPQPLSSAESVFFLSFFGTHQAETLVPNNEYERSLSESSASSVTSPSAEAKRGGHNAFMIGINDTHRWTHLLLSHAVWGFDA